MKKVRIINAKETEGESMKVLETILIEAMLTMLSTGVILAIATY